MPRIVEIPPESELRQQIIDLRRSVLRHPPRPDFLQSELDAEAGDIHLAAVEGGVVVGCCLLSKPFDGMANTLRLRQVAVDSSWQGKGLGRQIVAHAEEVAGRLGVTQICLRARFSAVGFYKKLNYVSVDVVTDEPSSQIMAKQLKLDRE
jgi:GNAT superfamily N-acetyltransferase